MDVKTIEKNGYIILRVEEDLSAKSNVQVLKSTIKKYLEQGQVNIAVMFTKNSFFHTQTISVLVQCIELVRERGGKLGIINPNTEIDDILHTINLNELVDIFSSEDEVGKIPAASD